MCFYSGMLKGAETVTKPKEKADFEQIEEIVTEKATGVIKKPILLDTDNE